MAVAVKMLQPGAAVPYQPAALDTWDSKYRLKGHDNTPLDADMHATFARVANTLAELEPLDVREHWRHEFLWALEHGAIPAGRILSNAGAEECKPATSTINCTVSGTIQDSMDGIMLKLREAALTLKAGCGIGYDFSTLRPRGAYVSGAGAATSGVLSFMDVFNAMCFTVSSAGGRRGAQMGCLDIGHPDVLDFIKAKREDGRLRQFNLSILIRREFVEAVQADRDWALAFPAFERDLTGDAGGIIYRHFPGKDPAYTLDEQGRTAMKVYRTLPARQLWNLIMSSTYDRAEPGFILIDEVNEMNNNWFCEDIRATNPCGEQPLPPYGSCLLGSINLVHFVHDAFTERARFDWERFNRVVGVFTRMLDNVVEINGLPLSEQREEITGKRRHGMGFLGLGSTLTLLRMSYGSADAVAFTERVARELAVTGWKTGLALAREKGPAPILQREFTVTPEMLHARPEMVQDGHRAGDRLPGRVLHARYSRYMQRLATTEPELVREIEKTGARFTHHSSIAPTGTIALSFGNNASNGIEPSFSHYYFRNVIRSGRKAKERVDVYSFEYLAYRHLVDSAATEADLPAYFTTAQTITPPEHLRIQAAAQKWVDSAISKTINVPTEISFDEFKNVYLEAVSHGLKGCTTFRFNPAVFQGVLVTESDLENTAYEFTVEDGTKLILKGTDQVEYEGEIHSAANLFDALKEGYYGRL